jgi:hypothetical protein
VLEQPNVLPTTNRNTTLSNPDKPAYCPLSSDPMSDNDSITSHFDKKWSNNLSINKMLPFEPGPILLKAKNPKEKSRIIDPHLICKMHPARMFLKDQLQGDTGANCGATNNVSILWYYKVLSKPIPITTYSKESTDEPSCVAIGTGILNIIANNNTITNWTMLHTPGSTGTILSPNQYMKDTLDVHEFRHN